jgi:hypothetical protein
MSGLPRESPGEVTSQGAAVRSLLADIDALTERRDMPRRAELCLEGLGLVDKRQDPLIWGSCSANSVRASSQVPCPPPSKRPSPSTAPWRSAWPTAGPPRTSRYGRRSRTSARSLLAMRQPSDLVWSNPYLWGGFVHVGRGQRAAQKGEARAVVRHRASRGVFAIASANAPAGSHPAARRPWNRCSSWAVGASAASQRLTTRARVRGQLHRARLGHELISAAPWSPRHR